jgi:hypothetical protein
MVVYVVPIDSATTEVATTWVNPGVAKVVLGSIKYCDELSSAATTGVPGLI